MTGQNFVYVTVAYLEGAIAQVAGIVQRMNPSNAKQIVGAGNAVFVDKVAIDFSSDANTKHGAASVPLTGTTPGSVDLTDLTSATSNTGSWDGDTTYASFTQLTVTNFGPGSVTIAQGASNPARLGFNGTTPTVTIPAGATETLSFPASPAVDSTHKVITFTPAATTVVLFAVSGN